MNGVLGKLVVVQRSANCLGVARVMYSGFASYDVRRLIAGI